jgi:hypothetical protein
LLAAGLAACWIGMRRIDNLRNDPVLTITTLLVTSSLYLVSSHWILRPRPRIQPPHLYLFILASAIGFRLICWPLYPAFSDDIFRYHWEGKLQAVGGGNPYLVAPSDPNWAWLRDETYPKVVLPDFKTIYGPVIELEQRSAYRLFADLPPFSRVFWMKLPSALYDLLTMIVIVLWLRARGEPVENILLYAWCPLPIFEFWINGHNDSMLVFFLTLALWLEARFGRSWTGAALALATATKLWPAILFPFVRDRVRSGVVGIGVFAILAWQYVADVLENAQYATGFLGGWRNNDSFYGLMLSLCGGDVYRAKYATFAILGSAIVWMMWRRYPLDRAAVTLIPLMLAISANVHPWYLTWLVPMLVVRPSAPFLLWVTLVPLHYVVLINWFALGQWDGVNGWRWLVYVPVYGWALVQLVLFSTPLLQKRDIQVIG